MLYTLDFGTLTEGSGTQTSDLEVLNSLLDALYQDTLSGIFDTTGVSSFSLTGVGAFSGIGLGSSRTGIQVSLDTSMGAGFYDETLILYASSVNASGSSALSDVQLRVTGTIEDPPAVPEPGTFVLLALGGAALLARRRKMN